MVEWGRPADILTLAALADLLIPAADGMPAASEAGAAGPWLDEVMGLRPDLGPPLAAILERLAGTPPEEALARLRSEDPAGFDVLTTVVAGAYFLNPEIRRRIRYPGQSPHPIRPEQPPDYEQDGLLASVRGRGPVYRPTPGRERSSR